MADAARAVRHNPRLDMHEKELRIAGGPFPIE
jgi:hypothetical protein